MAEVEDQQWIQGRRAEEGRLWSTIQGFTGNRLGHILLTGIIIIIIVIIVIIVIIIIIIIIIINKFIIILVVLTKIIDYMERGYGL